MQKGMKEQVQDMNSGDDRRGTLLNLIFEPNSHQFHYSYWDEDFR